jgi:nucleoside-diphosphate-sugar epimerase
MLIGLTGASGVLGRRLLMELVRDGHELVSFDADIRDADSVQDWVEGLDAVVHAAAIVAVRTVEERPSDAIAVNVGGTANIANAVAKSKRCGLVYLSTCHVYASKSAPLTESDATRATSLYGLTKLQGEEWIKLLVPRHLIIRIFSYFDPSQKPPFLVPALCTRIGNAPANAVLDLHDAYSVRDFADGQWVARVCASLIRKGCDGTVNCGTGKGYTVLECARMLSHAFGRPDIKWRPAGNPSGSTLIADIRRLNGLLDELPSVDLAASLAICAKTYGY